MVHAKVLGPEYVGADALNAGTVVHCAAADHRGHLRGVPNVAEGIGVEQNEVGDPAVLNRADRVVIRLLAIRARRQGRVKNTWTPCGE